MIGYFSLVLILFRTRWCQFDFAMLTLIAASVVMHTFELLDIHHTAFNLLRSPRPFIMIRYIRTSFQFSMPKADMSAMLDSVWKRLRNSFACGNRQIKLSQSIRTFKQVVSIKPNHNGQLDWIDVDSIPNVDTCVFSILNIFKHCLHVWSKARLNQIFKRSSQQIYNVTLFFVFFWVLYGLLGVQFFGELHSHCVRYNRYT